MFLPTASWQNSLMVHCKISADTQTSYIHRNKSKQNAKSVIIIIIIIIITDTKNSNFKLLSLPLTNITIS